jgi:hypothetical protein
MVVFMRGLAAFQAELTAKDYRYMKPGIEPQDWGDEMQLTDPFNNRIRFIERKADRQRGAGDGAARSRPPA